MAIRVDRMTRIAGIAGAALALSAGVVPAGPLGAEVAGAAVAPDLTPPRGSVGGLRSPVRGSITLEVDASDDGAGVAFAQAIVDGVPWAQVSLDPACVPSAPADPAARPCAPSASRVPLTVDVGALAIGPHRLQVRAVDAAGNEADLYDGTLAVAGPAPVLTSTVLLTIGDPPRTTGLSGGDVVGASVAPQCAYPRLSMMLDQRPQRVSRGRPVLRAHGRYRFRGTLTCRVRGVRRSASRGTSVELLNKIGRRVWAVTGATTTTRGRITVILAYRSSRTLIFRHRASTGTSQVRIPIVVSRRGER